MDILFAFLWGFTKDTSLLGLWITIMIFLITNDKKLKFDQLQKSAMLKKIKLVPIYIDDITLREPFESELKVNQKIAINHELITIHYGDDLKAKLESKMGI